VAQAKWYAGLKYIRDCVWNEKSASDRTSASDPSSTASSSSQSPADRLPTPKLANDTSTHTSEFNWLVICDDDSFMNLHYLRDYLDVRAQNSSPQTQPMLLGAAMTIRSYTFCMGGACCVYSAAAVRVLFSQLDDCWNRAVSSPYGFNSDLKLGYCMVRSNIIIEDVPLFFRTYPSAYSELRRDSKLSEERPNGVPERPISFHYIGSAEMNALSHRYYGVNV